MDVIQLFREFGYPGLVTGVLLYALLKQRAEIVALNDCIQTLIHEIRETRNDMKGFAEEARRKKDD